MDLTGWTIAFDLDGTLVETAPDLVGALNELLAEQGMAPLPYDQVRVMVGRGAKVMVERGYAATGVPLSDDLSPRLVERYIDLYRARIAAESHPFEGCLDTLDKLAAAGATLAVATNKRTDLSLALLDQLGMTRRFATVVGADRAPAAKPDASHIFFTVEQSGGDPKKTIMIGDSATDVDAAKNAGVPVIAMSFGYTEKPARELGADIVIDHYRELIPAIARISGR